MKNKQKGGQDNNTNKLAITNSPSTNNQQLVVRSSDGGDKDKFVPVKAIPYDIKIFSFLCILGIVFRIIFANASKDFATATIWGYSFTMLSLLGLLISSFAISNKNQMQQSTMTYVKNVLSDSLPTLLTIIIITVIILQNISFYDKINSGNVANEYYSFSGVSAFLIIVQIALVINYLFDRLKSVTSSKKDTGSLMAAMASELNSIILILSMANFAFIGMLQVILKYFSTDG